MLLLSGGSWLVRGRPKLQSATGISSISAPVYAIYFLKYYQEVEFN